MSHASQPCARRDQETLIIGIAIIVDFAKILLKLIKLEEVVEVHKTWKKNKRVWI